MISKDDVEKIEKLINMGVSVSTISRQTGISYPTIKKIKDGKTNKKADMVNTPIYSVKKDKKQTYAPDNQEVGDADSEDGIDYVDAEEIIQEPEDEAFSLRSNKSSFDDISQKNNGQKIKSKWKIIGFGREKGGDDESDEKADNTAYSEFTAIHFAGMVENIYCLTNFILGKELLDTQLTKRERELLEKSFVESYPNLRPNPKYMLATSLIMITLGKLKRKK